MAQLDWLEAAKAAVNANPEYRALGNADVVVAFKWGKAIRKVTLEAFEVGAIETIGEEDLRDAELVIEMSAQEWRRYLRRRGQGTGPSLLSLDLDKNVVRGRDPLDAMKFLRYHTSIQMLVDEGAALAA